MKLRDLDLTANSVNQQHSVIGIPPLERTVTHAGDHSLLRIATWLAVFAMVGVLGFFVASLLAGNGINGATTLVWEALNSRGFWGAVLVGFIAQVIDGALGMAYGISSTTFLLALGNSPVVASASVHIAEVFTTGVSGIAHVKLGNINKSLFLKLLLPGVLGAMVGAYALSSIDGSIVKPYISLYLLCMGIYIIRKALLKKRAQSKPFKHEAKLGFFGGLIDTLGGGGWGPVVTTTLISTSDSPRTIIGTVNFVEFFLTFASAIAFSLLISEAPWVVVGGLVVGGLFAAPFAAILCKHLPTKTLMLLVGGLIIVISGFNIYQAIA
jgi:hypothetical protein